MISTYRKKFCWNFHMEMRWFSRLAVILTLFIHCATMLDSSRNVMAHGDAWEGKFGKPLCTCERFWKWCPRASIKAWTNLILFANTSCRSGCVLCAQRLSKCMVFAGHTNIKCVLGFLCYFKFVHLLRQMKHIILQTYCSQFWNSFSPPSILIKLFVYKSTEFTYDIHNFTIFHYSYVF